MNPHKSWLTNYGGEQTSTNTFALCYFLLGHVAIVIRTPPKTALGQLSDVFYFYFFYITVIRALLFKG